MYQAIITKYFGPTNVRGSRIKATAAAGSITVPYDHALNSEGNHRAAAEALLKKLGWFGTYHGGGMPDDSGYCFVSETDDERDSIVIDPPAEDAA